MGTNLIGILLTMFQVAQQFQPGLVAQLPAILQQVLTRGPEVLKVLQAAEGFLGGPNGIVAAVEHILENVIKFAPGLKSLLELKPKMIEQIKRNAEAAIRVQEQMERNG